jgi:uncharacterized protein YndB with AHSA1/START domain
MRTCKKIVISLLLTTSVATQAQDKNTMESTFTMTLSKAMNAPLELVWSAWSDSALVTQWWGPEGFTAPVANMNFKEGGASLVCMRSPDAFEIYNSWSYANILPMHSIEFIQHFTDKDGNKLNPADIGLPPGIPESVPHMIHLEDLGNGVTKITVTESGYLSEQTVEISKAGMQQCLDKMERILIQKKQVKPLVVKKQVRIDASASKLWEVLTKPENIKEWLGGADVLSEWTAGSTIFFTGNWKGKEYKDKGVVLQFVPGKIFQFSYWSTFSGLPDRPENYSVITMSVEENNTITQLTLTQSNFATPSMYEHSDKNWDESLALIKNLAETR